MKTIIALLLLSTSAHAECLQWGRALNSGNRVCMVSDGLDRDLVVPGSVFSQTPCITCGLGSVTATATPFSARCLDGWTAVVVGGMEPMCARELRKPE